MKLLKHFTEQPFIMATGLAALVHSTWALAVLFAGLPPTWEPTSPASWAAWAYWLLPALLIAFALDVGQISTSAEIRAGERTQTKYATFIVFAIATYYLQWLYIAHHMPALELGAGVYSEGFAARVVLMTRNAAIWLVPALLPLSTTLYTLSGGSTEQPQTEPEQPDVKPVEVQIEKPKLAELAAVVQTPDEPDVEPDEPDTFYISCDGCSWDGEYTTGAGAKRALAAHKRHCEAEAWSLLEASSNGNGHHAN